jgi:hypothetical protein
MDLFHHSYRIWTKQHALPVSILEHNHVGELMRYALHRFRIGETNKLNVIDTLATTKVDIKKIGSLKKAIELNDIDLRETTLA